MNSKENRVKLLDYLRDKDLNHIAAVVGTPEVNMLSSSDKLLLRCIASQFQANNAKPFNNSKVRNALAIMTTSGWGGDETVEYGRSEIATWDTSTGRKI